MPVRDFDQFAGACPSNPNIGSNRGASGIDGTIASALGFCKGIQNPVTVVLGDLALLHDLNSLSLVQDSQYPLIVVVINNGGGGIFSFLPVSKYEHVFEKYFATAHDLNFEPLAKLFGLEYYHPVLNGEFQKTYNQCSLSDKSSLIEVRTNREKNYQLHQTIQQQIITAFEK
jgi:2-succinyl-5-enolpyruvyl-6-hydroxy-3-cyclohexene-1-carboxylate synthase